MYTKKRCNRTGEETERKRKQIIPPYIGLPLVVSLVLQLLHRDYDLQLNICKYIFNCRCTEHTLQNDFELFISMNSAHPLSSASRLTCIGLTGLVSRIVDGECGSRAAPTNKDV